MIYAPLVMPEVITGLSLLLFVAIDVDHGFWTITIAHTTLPIRIYSEIRLGVKPEINAICTILIAVVAVGLVAASLTAKLSGGRGRSEPIGVQLSASPIKAQSQEACLVRGQLQIGRSENDHSGRAD